MLDNFLDSVTFAHDESHFKFKRILSIQTCRKKEISLEVKTLAYDLS
jgi:hypothetical protein